MALRRHMAITALCDQFVIRFIIFWTCFSFIVLQWILVLNRGQKLKITRFTTLIYHQPLRTQFSFKAALLLRSAPSRHFKSAYGYKKLFHTHSSTINPEGSDLTRWCINPGNWKFLKEQYSPGRQPWQAFTQQCASQTETSFIIYCLIFWCIIKLQVQSLCFATSWPLHLTFKK